MKPEKLSNISIDKFGNFILNYMGFPISEVKKSFELIIKMENEENLFDNNGLNILKTAIESSKENYLKLFNIHNYSIYYNLIKIVVEELITKLFLHDSWLDIEYIDNNYYIVTNISDVLINKNVNDILYRLNIPTSQT